MLLLKPSPMRFLSLTLIGGLLISTTPTLQGCSPSPEPSTQASPTPPPPSPIPSAAPTTVTAPMVPGPPPGAASAEQLQELVSPIALYPDLLVARILAASTYPDQVVAANTWLQQNPKLTGDQLATAVNIQPWDPSIKTLTQFPTVLQTMSDSLAWTSALGEAYYNQPADVMDAIQVLRNRAVDAGTLKTTPQQTVEVQPAPTTGGQQPAGQQQTVTIHPAQPSVVYVPQYNPTTSYGTPVAAPVGYTGSQMLLTGLLSFGAGIALGALINSGDDDWDCDWHGHSGGSVHYNNNVYINNSPIPPRANYPGYYPPNYYPPRGAAYPRPVTYPEARTPYGPGGPVARPYDRANARRYASNNPDIARPDFPAASTLPANAGGGKGSGNRVSNQPARRPEAPVGPSTRPVQPNPRPVQPANRPAQQPAGPGANRGIGGDRSAARGFDKGKNAAGNGGGAFGGYQPGGLAQVSSDRGRSSFNGGGNGGGRDRGQAGGGGRNQGGARRGGGGGGGRRR